MDGENNINWVDAFKDEAFMAKLRETFEMFLEEHEMSDEEFDDVLEEMFKYDEQKEGLTFNKEAFKKAALKQPVLKSDNDPSPSNSEDGNDQQLTDEEIENSSNNLRLLLLLKLMKDNGLELDKNNMSGDKSQTVKHKKHGNGVRAAKLMRLITGLPLQSCKNFITNPTISTKSIADLVTKINSLLIDMGMRIRID